MLEAIFHYVKNQNTNNNIAEIIFSKSDKLPYDDTISYLAEYNGSETNWSKINPNNIYKFTLGRYAGLQFVDTVASSFFNVVRCANVPNSDTPANLLKPTIYNKDGIFFGYGIKFYPENIRNILGYEWLLWNYR